MQEWIIPILVALVLVFWVILTVRFAKNKLAPVKSVKAVVSQKTKLENTSKYAGTGKRERYCVVFETEEGKRSFYVPRFSYEGYSVNEQGTLKYKGDQLIDFS